LVQKLQKLMLLLEQKSEQKLLAFRKRGTVRQT
jgi:hypothetical protein